MDIFDYSNFLITIFAVAPDGLMFQLVKERLCQLDCVKKGWILHGYPRTREQAVRMTEIGLEPNR